MTSKSGATRIPKSRTLSRKAQHFGEPVRRAVGLLARALEPQPPVALAWARVLGPRARPETAPDNQNIPVLVAWGVVSMHLVGRCGGALASDATLEDAEAWFCGPPTYAGTSSLTSFLPARTAREACSLLEGIAAPQDLIELLPYVLDPHGPGSRLSVRADASTQTARDAKKRSGVFYTPPDVADYITRTAIQLHTDAPSTLTVLDPACGTGVFLRSALKYILALNTTASDAFAVASRCLYGIDIDPLAVQAACFVLLADTFQAASASAMTPWGAWHQLRLNLAVADALTLTATGANHEAAGARRQLKRKLASAYVPPAEADSHSFHGLPLFSAPLSLQERLPELAAGADVLVGNPPYADIGYREDADFLSKRFATFDQSRNRGKQDLYPLFIELMWQLTKPQCSAAGMVVPLSLACHEGSQFVDCRKALGESGGHWRFAFFDREPHALFGEDVKTRNTIVFRRACDTRTPRQRALRIDTGPMLKWRSTSREQLFESITFTPLMDIDIAPGIPKLSTALERDVLSCIQARSRPLASVWSACHAIAPDDVGKATRRHVFAGSTAYNFINVFFRHDLPLPDRAPSSTNKVHALEFVDSCTANAAFAVLSSRLSFWLWRVYGDGFHVTRRFLSRLPFPSQPPRKGGPGSLSTLGSEMWQELQQQQVVSVNGGRQSIAYRPCSDSSPRDQIDKVLIGRLGLPENFAAFLRTYTNAVVAGEMALRETTKTELVRMSTPNTTEENCYE